ncbi:MAG TPA: dihydrolipoamide acetyltransferase family protein [Acidimicrobiales bacterium]|nr:dihydrolipoamide acetyltransferase family protein [Acidimicrobiales bacterium]
MLDTEVRLVQEGMAMQEGVVTQWLKALGDHVDEGEVIAEAEAAKATVEIVAPVAGTLTQILVAAGVEVPIRTVLAVITPENESPVLVSPRPDAEAVPKTQVVPAARRLARDEGIDLAAVVGTGPGGRIVEADVRRAVAGASRDVVSEVIPLHGIRGTIAGRLVGSLQSMAQFTLMTEVDVTDLVRKRSEIRTELVTTYNHCVMRACVLALAEHPRLNAIVTDGEIRVQSSVHLGMAVPIAGGLVVGVIRDADRMSFPELIAAARSVVAEIKAGRAGADLLTGSTFTVSNLGSHGVDTFTPIINPPEVAIVGVGRVREHPLRRGEGFVWGHRMGLSLTVDHRAIDGVPAATFLQAVGHYLQDPEALFASD